MGAVDAVDKNVDKDDRTTGGAAHVERPPTRYVHQQQQRRSVASHVRVRVRVLGAHNTGTNLMARLLRTRSCVVGRKFWKHMPCPQMLDAEVAQACSNGTHLFLMVRHPASWLVSMRKAPYEWRVATTANEALGRPPIDHTTSLDTTPIVLDDAASTSEVPPGARHYPSLVALYNHYTAMFVELATKYPHQCTVVAYDVLIDPVRGCPYFAARVARAVGHDADADVDDDPRTRAFHDVLARPAKTHGKSVKNAREAFAKTHARYSTLTSREKDIVVKTCEPWWEKALCAAGGVA